MQIVLALKRIVGLQILCHPAVGRLIAFLSGGAITSRGSVINIRNNHISRENVARIFWGLYERAEIGLTKKYLRRDLDVVELGSSLGIVSLSILRVQDRDKKLICVEANSHLVETIRDNIRANAPWKDFDVLNRAVDYGNRAEVNVSIDSGNLGSRVSAVGNGRGMLIRTITLEALLAAYDIKEFALVSDIEGAEVGVITKDGKSLERCRQLIIELHDVNFEGETYTVQALREKIETLHGFNLVASRNDVFVFERR